MKKLAKFFCDIANLKQIRKLNKKRIANVKKSS